MSEEKKVYPKEQIAEGAITGGLVNEDVRQHYRFNYMLPTDDFPQAKLELALLLMKDKYGEPKERIESYRSIRFVSTAQMMTFLVHSIKAYFYFQKKNGTSTPRQL